MKEHFIMTVADYDRIDGINAYRSNFKKMTLGEPVLEENKNTKIALQLWKQNEEGKLFIDNELPIHQVMDLMIFLSRTMLYFCSAYRMPLLYDPENPVIERIGIQGGVMPIEICTDNPHINQDIQNFYQELSRMGELTGERLRRLKHILDKMEY